MEDSLYFAYGSNLLRERLLARCPNLEYVGMAALPDQRLTLDKVSVDGSGKCAFESAAGEEVLGVLWNVPDIDLPALARAEGVGQGYEWSKVTVVAQDGRTMTARVCAATNRQTDLRPYDWYLALVIAGAMQQRLPANYVEKIRAAEHWPDTDLARGSRLDALQALDAAGMTSEFDALSA